jgi:hypothetical protein
MPEKKYTLKELSEVPLHKHCEEDCNQFMSHLKKTTNRIEDTFLYK